MHNNEDVYDLNGLIKDIIDARIDEYIKSNGIERSYDATVIDVSPIATEDGETINPYEQYASVQLYRDSGNITNVRNLSGEILAEEDHVKIYMPKNNLNNSYIGVKCM